MILLKDRLKELEGLIDSLADAKQDAGYYAEVGGSLYSKAVDDGIKYRLQISRALREIQAEYEVLDHA